MKKTTSNECHRRMLAAWLGAAVLGLAACGGGGGGSDTPVGNTGGGTTAPAAAPAITAQPQALVVKSGQGASFTVTASGDGPLSYRWQRNGADIDGVTAASYSFTASQANDDQAVFTVRVSNAAGSVTSQPVTLTVRSALADTLGVVAGDVNLAPVSIFSIGDGYNLATPDGTGAQAKFQSINGMVADAQGNVYLAERYKVRKISPGGVVTTIVSAPPPGFVIFLTPQFGGLTDIALGQDGNLYVSDEGLAVVWKVTPNGSMDIVAGQQTPAGAYVDGPVATARFKSLQSIATDAAGNIYVLDSNLVGIGAVTPSLVVRKISPQGQVTTVPGGVLDSFVNRGKLAVDASGNILVAVSRVTGGYCITGGCWKSSERSYILKITPSGERTVLAGSATEFSAKGVDGTAGAARFVLLHDIALDTNGDLYVTDSSRAGSVRKVTPQGVVTTVVGSLQDYGDAYPETVSLGALPARVVSPDSVAVSPKGDLYLTSGRPSFYKDDMLTQTNRVAFDGSVVLKATLK